MGLNKLVSDIEHAYEQVAADGPLEQLEALKGARDLIDWYIEKAAQEARNRGLPYTQIDDVDGETRHQTAFRSATWREIGDALGISRQAACKRFAE